jgi:hypothetical protein
MNHFVNGGAKVALLYRNPSLRYRVQLGLIDVEAGEEDKGDDEDGEDVCGDEDPDVVELTVPEGALDSIDGSSYQQAEEYDIEKKVEGAIYDGGHKASVRLGRRHGPWGEETVES